MDQAQRNDAKAQRLIDMLYAEGVSPENIVRLLNYHFSETYILDKDARTHKLEIRRVPDDSNWAPPVIVWKQQ